MSNMMDYIDWRGDILFTSMGLNDIDNLILATLSYVYFEDIVPGPLQGEITISKAASLYSSKYPDWDKEAVFFLDEPPKLLMKCATSKRFSQLILKNYVTELTEEIQFSALEILLPDGTTYISYRGTDESIIGWKEDFYLSLGTVPSQKAASAYLNQIFQNRPLCDAKIYVGGHSKGGNLAVYASASCEKTIREHILKITSFDGPGFEADFLDSTGYKDILPRVFSFVPDYSIIGMLLKQGIQPTIVKSSDDTILAHDPFTWQVLGPWFELAAEMDKSAEFFNQALDDWISQLSSENRKLFIDELFSVLEAPGLNNFRELYNKGFTVIAPMIQRLNQADPKSQKIILKLIQIILENASELATNALTKWFS